MLYYIEKKQKYKKVRKIKNSQFLSVSIRLIIDTHLLKASMIAFVANTIGFLVSSTFFLFTGSAVFSFAAVGGGVPLENKENKEENKEEKKEENKRREN